MENLYKFKDFKLFIMLNIMLFLLIIIFLQQIVMMNNQIKIMNRCT